MNAAIKSLIRDLTLASGRLTNRSGGLIELAYRRGYQAGYSHAMMDCKEGRQMLARNAMKPFRKERDDG